MRTFLKLAGGSAGDDEISLDEFMVQAEEYETGGDAVTPCSRCSTSSSARTRSTRCARPSCSAGCKRGAYDRDHSPATIRAAAKGHAPLGDDYVDAAGYYGGRRVTSPRRWATSRSARATHLAAPSAEVYKTERRAT